MNTKELQRLEEAARNATRNSINADTIADRAYAAFDAAYASGIGINATLNANTVALDACAED